MTKTELINQLNTLNENTKLPKGYADQLMNLVNQLNVRQPKAESNPPKLDDQGNIVEVWCLKHETYEPVSEFATSTKGNTGYHNKCRIADYQWKDYLAKIKVVQADIDAAINEERYTDLPELQAKKVSLTSEKDSAYVYPDADEIERIVPKKKEL